VSLLVNGLFVHTMRWHAAWSGVWSAEIDYAGDVSPSGKVAIASTEGIALVGTVDSERSGVFGEKRHLHVNGGGGGWSKKPREQHYHSDIGLPLQVVASTTAAEVGELVTVLFPLVVGLDYTRSGKLPASQIFEGLGLDWWVATTGVTFVGIRPPLPPHPSLTVLDWQPEHGTVSFTCESLVEPGTVLVDTRFGRKIVREVEAVVSSGSVSGTLFVADAPPENGSASELADLLSSVARSATRADYSRFYEYVVIAMAGDRVELQSISRGAGMPDILPASVWAGSSGYKATLAPASRVLVGFRGGDPTKPFVAFYEEPEGDGWRPLASELDALFSLTIGKQALAVILGDVMTAQPIARAPAIAAFATAVATAITAAASAATATGVTPVTGATLGGFLATAGTAIATAAGTLATACPSTKAMSS
jgi:hypothetical protein